MHRLELAPPLVEPPALDEGLAEAHAHAGELRVLFEPPSEHLLSLPEVAAKKPGTS